MSTQRIEIVVAAVVDTTKTTFYREDGTTFTLLQGDKRLRPILERITPLLMVEGAKVEVDLSQENHYSKFEEKSGKGIKFFRIAKKTLQKIFGMETDVSQPRTMGEVPDTTAAAEGHAKVATAVNAVASIMEHGTPATAADFQSPTVAEQRPVAESSGFTPNDHGTDGEDTHHKAAEDTIVAVTKSGKVVAGMEMVQSQIEAAAKNGSVRGMEILIERMGRVAAKRRHTVKDLLRFMERGDLPVADDGSIIIYKRLYREKDGRYTDPHTRKVSQTIGSFVHMDETLVDPNRRNECSNGLHVGRRGYMRSFSGDVIVIAKVRPEDVIAVPDYDANKMRVCGYHIIFELTQAQFQAINQNRPMSDAEGGAELLGRAIAGDHIGVTEHVKITQQKGGGLIITPKQGEEVITTVDAERAQEMSIEEGTRAKVETTPNTPREKGKKEPATKKPKSKKPTAKELAKRKKAKAARDAASRKARKAAAAAKPVTAIDSSVTAADAPVDIQSVVALTEGKQADLSTPAKPQITQKDMIRDLVQKAIEGDRDSATKALAAKKAAKKNWPAWGLPENTGRTLQSIIDGNPPQ